MFKRNQHFFQHPVSWELMMASPCLYELFISNHLKNHLLNLLLSYLMTIHVFMIMIVTSSYLNAMLPMPGLTNMLAGSWFTFCRPSSRNCCMKSGCERLLDMPLLGGGALEFLLLTCSASLKTPSSLPLLPDSRVPLYRISESLL